VLVLHEAISPDARADELDALVQVEQVSEALRQQGWGVTSLATGLELETTQTAIREWNPDCVFNLVESLAGDGRLIHFIPALLETAGVSFTGCNSDAIYLSSNKLLAKRWMDKHGISTPAILTSACKENDASGRWIVKSVWEHASFGMDDGCIVDGAEAAWARIEASKSRYGGEWFAEAFIDGREFNISVLEQRDGIRILPAAEMTFVDYPADKPKFVGYAAKWDEEAPEYHATQRQFASLPDQLGKAINQVVEKCWQCFGLGGYARVDFRVDVAGKPWVLEVNANPCIAKDAGFIAAALQAGISYNELVNQLVQTSGLNN
jgi:D-alanine-D-alanine ligase